jgi:acyl-CoA synthetase (AMP-forming)/AMP-acid ligase II
VLLHHLVVGRAGSDPDGAALIGPAGEIITWSGLATSVEAVAGFVSDLLPDGARVGAVGPNHPGWIDLYYGVPAGGGVLVPLNHRLAPAELASQIDRAGVSVVIGDDAHLRQLADVGVGASLMRPWPSDWVTRGRGALSSDSSGSDDVAWLLFTSGTTGTPKGAMLTHASLLAAVDASAAARPVDPDDVYLFCFPLCHVAGYNVVHRHAHGRPVVLAERFEPQSFCSAVGRYAVTSTSLAATMLSALCDHLDVHPADVARLATLRLVAYGAAPMPPALLRRAHQLLPGVGFTQGYGMTELSGNAVFLGVDDHRRALRDGDDDLLAAAGRPAPGVELRVTAPETGVALPCGQVGEIEVRAGQVMAGYWEDPEATAASLRDGWLRTGDLGWLGDDGLLRVVDRSKDMIITGGENVASREVEDVVLTVPAVAAAAVVGVPDPHWGENVCAVVVARPGATIDADDVVATVRQRLAGFKAPRHVVIVDALPVNAGGKVLKGELRAWLAEHPDVLGPRRSGK